MHTTYISIDLPSSMINIFIKDRTNQLVDICKSLLLNTFETDGKMGQFKEWINDPTVNILHYICYYSKYLFSNEHDLFDIVRLLIQKHAYASTPKRKMEKPLLMCSHVVIKPIVI